MELASIAEAQLIFCKVTKKKPKNQIFFAVIAGIAIIVDIAIIADIAGIVSIASIAAITAILRPQVPVRPPNRITL